MMYWIRSPRTGANWYKLHLCRTVTEVIPRGQNFLPTNDEQIADQVRMHIFGPRPIYSRWTRRILSQMAASISRCVFMASSTGEPDITKSKYQWQSCYIFWFFAVQCWRRDGLMNSQASAPLKSSDD